MQRQKLEWKVLKRITRGKGRGRGTDRLGVDDGDGIGILGELFGELLGIVSRH